MPMIQLTAPTKALTSEGRTRVQYELARVLLRWEGAPETACHEQPDGAWGAGGSIIDYAGVVALATGQGQAAGA